MHTKQENQKTTKKTTKKRYWQQCLLNVVPIELNRRH